MDKQLIKVEVNQNNEQAVSARELHEKLKGSKNFKEFFIKVSELKTAIDNYQLRTLRAVVLAYSFKYGIDAVIYLADSIDTERALPCRNIGKKAKSEKEYRDEIISHFDEIFPQYRIAGCEVPVCKIGRIDILAKDVLSSRAVVIELKIGNKSPNSQLIAYGKSFQKPILIGITEQELPKQRQLKYIQYFTYDDLKRRCKNWTNS